MFPRIFTRCHFALACASDTARAIRRLTLHKGAYRKFVLEHSASATVKPQLISGAIGCALNQSDGVVERLMVLWRGGEEEEEDELVGLFVSEILDVLLETIEGKRDRGGTGAKHLFIGKVTTPISNPVN